MFASQQLWFLRGNTQKLKRITAVVAGSLMLSAIFLPWLKDPLGNVFSAWQLPINIGWQFRWNFFNYGLLCALCAVYAYFVAFANWKPFYGSRYFENKHVVSGLLCCIPVAVYLLQFICVDIHYINGIGMHQIQVSLIYNHLGYSVSQPRIALSPLSLDVSTIQGRFELLVNQASFGLLLPCLSAFILIDFRRLFSLYPRPTISRNRNITYWFLCIATLIFLVVLGRAPVALFCEYQAESALAAGNNSSAMGWLDSAHFLNPELDQVANYHIDRGQALYFLYPNQQSDDSRAYLANAYLLQGDRLGAYQQLLAVWQAYPTTPWVVDEMSITLERLAESTHPLKVQPVEAIGNDEKALLWLQLLVQVDPSNAYGHYMIGRIQYMLHDSIACMQQMAKVIQLSHNTILQSSGYTYIGLSEIEMGNYSASRSSLFKAVQLDPNYYNNTAREELSGLR